jgi:hypothetical protein
MIINVHLEDGSSVEQEVDFKTMSVEDRRPYADMGIPSALSAMKNLIGYDYLKPAKDMTRQDAREYLYWLKKNNPAEYERLEASTKEDKGTA